MSKTVKLKTSDVYNVDDDLDLGGFDFESGSGEDFMSDSRAPVTKLRDGVVEGMKDTLTSPTFLKKQIKDTLPSGYGTAMDMADQSIEGLKQLYDNAGKELKPVVKDLKRVTGKMLPMFDGMLPSAWSAKVKEWAKEEKSFNQEQIDQKEAAINASLGQIFGKLEEANQQRDAENKASEALQGEVDKKRFEANFGQLNDMRMGITQLAAYKKNVESQYQRKSLELQFRSYYALADILTEMKDFNGNAKEKLSGILRNTGLPEIVKTQNSEYLQDIMKNDFIGGIYDGVFGQRRNFFQNLSQGLVKRATGGLKSFKDSFMTGLSAAEMSADQIQMMKESGMLDPYSMAGNVAGAGLMERMGTHASKMLKGVIGKNEKVKKFNDRLQYEADGAQGTINDWADSYANEGGMMGWVTGPIKEEIRRLRGREQSAQLMQGDVLNEPGMFTRRTDKSINEVIPGFLARILQEQTRARLGTDDVDLVAYDYNAGKFSTSRNISQSIGKMFDKKYINSNITRDVDAVLALIDPTGEKFSEDQRKLIGQTLLKNNIEGKKLTKESLTDSWNYRGGKRGDAEHISNVMGNYLGEGMDYAKLAQLQRRYQQVGTGNRIDYKKIQDLIHLGYGEQLLEMGIIDENGRIKERDLLLNSYLSGDKSDTFSPYGAETQSTAKGAVKRSKRVLGRGAATTAQGGRSERGDTFQLDEAVFAPTNSILEKILAANTEALTLVKGASSSSGSDYQGKVLSGMDQIREILTGIHEQLLTGIRFAGFGDGALTTGGKSQWYNKTIGQLFKGARAKAEGWKNKGMEKFTQFKNWGMDKGATAKSWFDGKLPGWKDKAKGLWGKGKAKFDNIYVEAEGKIRLVLDKVKLEQGDYWDVNTNTKITKFSDITGAVEDRSKDPAEIVLTEEQAKQAFVLMGKGRQLLSKLTKFKDWALEKLSFGQRRGSVLLRLARMTAKKLWKRFTDEPVDIYVAGDLEHPVLYASMMRNGAYVSKYRGHLVDRPSKIDGPVMNRFKDNEIVVNEEQFKLGLVTIDGKPIKTGMAKLFQKGKDLATAGMNQIKKLWGSLKATGGKILGKGWERFSKWAKDSNVLNPGSVMVVNRLDKIIQILETRLPGGKKKLGDLNGDGIVENSYEDIVAKRKAQAKEKLAAMQDKAKGGIDALKGSSLLAGIANFFKKKDKAEEEEEEDDDSLLDGASDLKDSWDMAKDAGEWMKEKGRNGKRRLGRMFGRKGAKAAGDAAKRGLFRRGVGAAGRGLRGGGSLAARGLMAGGRVAGSAAGLAGRAIASPIGWLGRGAMAAAGSSAVTGAVGGAMSLAGSGLAAAGTATMGALGGLASAAGGIAAGIGALMSAPVIIGGLVAGAAAYGAYKGYKYFTRNKMNSLEEARYAQYGFNPSDNQYWSKICQLEEEVFKNTRFDDASPSVDEKNLKVQAIAEDFGVNLEDQQQVVNFIQWYRMRFKPVYMQHLTAWKRSGTKEDFTDIGDLTPQEKQKYFSFAKFPNGPYGVTISPFPELAQLTAGKAVVDVAVAKAQAEIDKELKEKKTDVAKVAGAAAGGAAVGAVAKAVSTPGKALVPPAPKTLAQQLEQQAGKGVGDYSKIDNQGMKALGGTIAITGSYIPMVGVSNGKVDALSAIRFKTYGLKELEVAKIRALSTLENGMVGKIKYNAKKVAMWMGSTQEMVNQFAPAFGIDIMDPIESGMWSRWFASRFLPAYLNFASALYAATGKEDPIAAMNGTTDAQNLDAAMAIVGSNNKDGSPVWGVVFTPWRNYPLNSKSSSVDEHIAVLKAAQGNKLANAERTKVAEDDKQQNNTASKVGAGVENKDRSLMDSIGDVTSSMWNSLKNSTAGKFVGDAVGGAVDWAKNTTVGKAVGEAADWAMDKAGQAVDFITGTGGTYDSIIKPQGDGSMGVYKQMIEQVSQIVGVDPKLMLTMAAIESNFRGRVKAKTSSATGLYQFITDTWRTMIKRYGAKYGLPTNVQPTDPVANALMGAEYIKENAKILKSVRPQLTDTDLYLAHFLGPGGAKKLLAMDPSGNAVAAMPKAAGANKSIFFENDGKGRPRSASEVYAEVNRRVRTRAVQVGLEKKGSTMAATVPPPTAGKVPPAPAATTAATPTTAAPKAALVASSTAAPAPTAAAASDAAPAKKATMPVNVVTPATSAPPPAPVPPTPQSAATQNAGLNMGTTNDLLGRSYQTQQGILKVLQEIKEAINQRKPEGTGAGASMPVNGQTTKVPRQTTSLGKIPVDPMRTVFGN